MVLVVVYSRCDPAVETAGYVFKFWVEIASYIQNPEDAITPIFNPDPKSKSKYLNIKKAVNFKFTAFLLCVLSLRVRLQIRAIAVFNFRAIWLYFLCTLLWHRSPSDHIFCPRSSKICYLTCHISASCSCHIIVGFISSS